VYRYIEGATVPVEQEIAQYLDCKLFVIKLPQILSIISFSDS